MSHTILTDQNSGSLKFFGGPDRSEQVIDGKEEVVSVVYMPKINEYGEVIKEPKRCIQRFYKDHFKRVLEARKKLTKEVVPEKLDTAFAFPKSAATGDGAETT